MLTNKLCGDKREIELSLDSLAELLYKFPDQARYLSEEWVLEMQKRVAQLLLKREQAEQRAKKLGIL